MTWGNQNNTSSGTTPTDVSQIFYDADDNTIWLYNSGVKNDQRSLPIAEVTMSNGTVTSIDQIFNGFGYIGSTIFALPGVEGLIPNYRNVDGSLNNVEWTCNSVIARTISGFGNYDYYLGFNGQGFSLIRDYLYNQDENINLTQSVSWPSTWVGNIRLNSDVITSFKPKTTFQAADYYDVPKLATDNTFTGVNIIDTGEPNSLNIKSSNINQNVNPSSYQYSNYINFLDVNNNLIGRIFATKEPSGRQGISIQSFYGDRNITIGVRATENGTYTYTSTPPTTDNSTQIATTAWVRSSVGVQTGTIIAFAGSSAPTGYLACNGAAVSRTTYSALFNVIGTRWGSGDGSTTFNLPNLNSGRFLRGNSSAGGYNNAGLPNITGSFSLIAGASISERTGAFFAGNSIVADQMGGAGVNTNVTQFSAQRSSSIYGASSTVMPLSANVLFCIKY